MTNLPPIDADITRAYTLPASFYRDEALFVAQQEQIFARSWQYVGHVSDLPEVGSQHPFVLLPGLLDEPLVLVRGADGIRCLSNVCTHRGNLLLEHPACAKALRCRYHGRRFGLDGQMLSMPEFEGVVDFPGPSDHLIALPLKQWGPFLFTALDPAQPFEEWIAPLEKRLGHVPFSDFAFQPEKSRDYPLAAHWALYMDNYLEGLHIPFIHPALSQALDFKAYETHQEGSAVIQIGIADGDAPRLTVPEGHTDAGKDLAAIYVWLFPNLIFNVYPWGLSLNIIQPVTRAEMRICYRTWVGDASLLGQGAGADVHAVEAEDQAVILTVQQGLKGRLYQRGRFSPSYDSGVHHFHSLCVEALEI